MDVNGDMALPISPPAATGPSGHAASGKPDLPPYPAGKGAGTRPAGNAEVRKVVRKALNVDSLPNRELRIEFESDIHRIVVKVLDKESGEVIRQIPMAEEIANEKQIKEQLSKMAREQRAFFVDLEA